MKNLLLAVFAFAGFLSMGNAAVFPTPTAPQDQQIRYATQLNKVTDENLRRALFELVRGSQGMSTAMVAMTMSNQPRVVVFDLNTAIDPNDKGGITDLSSRTYFDVNNVDNTNIQKQTIIGFVIGGTDPKSVLIRCVGPSLAKAGVSVCMPYPRFDIHSGSDTIFVSGPWWWRNTYSAIGGDGDNGIITDTQNALFARLGASQFDSGSYDAAALRTLAPGVYSSVVWASTADDSGICLCELYDANLQANSSLINISTRGYNVGTGERVMIIGFVLARPQQVLVRAVGPGMSGQGVTNLLAHTSIRVVDMLNNGATIATNSGWCNAVNAETSAATNYIVRAATAADMAAVGAFALQPGSADSALVLLLPAGVYSVVLTGPNGEQGNALFEAYAMGSPVAAASAASSGK